MEITDVMVGDFLQNTNGNVGRVIGIQPYNQGPSDIIMNYNGGTCFSDTKMLQPIPLTTEILEKNFSRPLFSRCFFDGNDFYELMIHEVNDGTWIIKHDNIEFSHIPRQQVLVGYVHELQHALRLCGIEKEIVL